MLTVCHTPIPTAHIRFLNALNGNSKICDWPGMTDDLKHFKNLRAHILSTAKSSCQICSVFYGTVD